MLQINLLPPYIYEGAHKRNVTILWGTIILLVIIGVVLFRVKLGRDADRIASNTSALQNDAIASDAAKTQAAATIASTKDTKDKCDFIVAARDHDIQVYPSLFTNIANYTLRSILYDSVTPTSGSPTVTISAYAPSLTDLGHYMLGMENNPAISNLSIAMAGAPTYPGNWGKGNQPPPAAAANSSGGYPSQYGSSYGSAPYGSQGPSSYVPGNVQSYGGGPSGYPSSGSSYPSSGSGGYPGSSGSSYPSSYGSGGSGSGAAAPSKKRPPKARGYDFTAVLTLIKPVPAGPLYPSAGGAPAAGPMGAAGMPGGMGPGSSRSQKPVPAGD